MSGDLFEYKLLNRIYKTAYDPISKRYVSIVRAEINNRFPINRITVLARRVGESCTFEYDSNSLINYSIN